MELLRVKRRNYYDYYIKPSKYRGYVRFNPLGHNIMHGLSKPERAKEININDVSTWIDSSFNCNKENTIDNISKKMSFIIKLYDDQAV